MNIHWETRENFLDAVTQKINPTFIVLDVGAGIRPQSFFIPAVHVIIEPFHPYIETLQNQLPRNARIVFLKGTWNEAMPIIPDKSIDTLFAIDVIEHMEKEDGRRFLKEAERISRVQVALFTPLGFYKQEYDHEDSTDRWGMKGGYWQRHLSGWEPGDFDESWDIIACKDFHLIDQNENELDEPQGAFWAIRTFANAIAPLEERISASEFPLKKLIKYTSLRFKLKIIEKFHLLMNKLFNKN